MSSYNEQLNDINNKLSNTLSFLNDLKITETIEQGMPSITVNPNGLVAATVSQIEGYVREGTVESTHQISQIDEPNLIPENIKAGVSIFGVDGEHQGGNFDEGKQAAYNEFWDNFQDNGNRVNYERAFSGFTVETFKPKYDIKPTHVYGMFWGCQMNIDLQAKLDELGIVLDFSNSGYGNGSNYIFSGSKFTRIGVVNTTNWKSNVPQTFQNCSQLITIDKLILREDGAQAFTQTFTSCSKLENISIEGKIGQDCAFNYSKNLTRDSLVGKVVPSNYTGETKNLIIVDNVAYYEGILGALYDYSGTSTTKTLALSATNLAKLSDIEKAVAT